jgi:hypothetical protein
MRGRLGLHTAMRMLFKGAAKERLPAEAEGRQHKASDQDHPDCASPLPCEADRSRCRRHVSRDSRTVRCSSRHERVSGDGIEGVLSCARFTGARQARNLLGQALPRRWYGVLAERVLAHLLRDSGRVGRCQAFIFKIYLAISATQDSSIVVVSRVEVSVQLWLEE